VYVNYIMFTCKNSRRTGMKSQI